MQISIILLCILASNQALQPLKNTQVQNIDPLKLESIIKIKKHLFTNFYASNCGFCKLLNPIFEQAAKSLYRWQNQSDIFIQVNADSSDVVARQYGIDGFPKLKYFLDGQMKDYQGSRNHQDLFNFVLRELGIFTTNIYNQEELDEFTKSNNVVGLLYHSENLKEHQLLLNMVAKNFGHVIFAVVSNSTLRSQLLGEGENFLLQKYSEFFHFKQPFNYNTMFTFLTENSYPDVIEFDDQAIERIFHLGNAGLFLLVDNTDESVRFEKIFREAALKFKEKIIFCIARKEEDLFLFSKLQDYLGPKEGHMPVIFITKSIGHQKYLFDKELSVQNIKTFIESFNLRNLTRYFKSEDVPIDNDSIIKTIVGSTFDDIVMKSDTNYCVTFYQSTCSHCEKFLPIFEEIAIRFKDVDDLKFGIVESIKNEVPKISMPGYPTVYLFKKGQKSAPIQFYSEKTRVNLIKFIEINVIKDQRDQKGDL